MGTSRRYPRAPIAEAVIDLHVEPRDGLALADLESFAAEVQRDYPTRKKRFQAQGRIEIGDQLSTSASSRQVGWAFVTSDEKHVVQASLDEFTFSRLAPYESWDPFRCEARRWWRVYRQLTAPQRVTRLGVRYINRIDIPAAHVEMKDYFRTSPEISPDLPQTMEAFFLHVTLPQDDIDCHAVLNETVVPSVTAGTTSVVLDIDLFRMAEVPADDQAIWELFETLRSRKNVIFEACITDRTRELFR